VQETGMAAVEHLADDEIKSAGRRAFAEVIGGVAWLMSQTPDWSAVPLSALQHLVSTPVRLGQFKLYRNKGTPFAFAAWAFLDEKTEDRILSGSGTLRAEDWDSGSNPWIISLVAPFGGADQVLPDLISDKFGDRQPKFLLTEFEVRNRSSNPALAKAQKQRTLEKFVTIARISPENIAAIEDGVVDLLRQLIDGPHYAGHVFDGGRVRRLIRAGLPRPHQALFVATLGRDVLGLFIGEVQPSPFDNGRLGREIAFIVRENSRDCGIGTKLIEAFRDWATSEQGATLIQFVHTSGISPDAADHVYSKIGAVRVGAVWRMNTKGNFNAA
jgi:hemolysin-activating ACP:hemolysin acyltransferase/GNAT superfamily N-acetyltransferase